MPPIVSIVGKSKVGKTTLIERLVAELKRRGYRVATVKHDIHSFEIDQPGKDSWRHAQAGSDAVVISSPEKIALIKKVDHDSSLEEIRWLLGDDFDIVLAEGFKRGKAPKIEVYRKAAATELLCSPSELMAVATDESLGLGVPEYALDDAAGLADLIQRKCLARHEEEEVSLLVNGTPVPLNPFVKGIMAKTLLGMVSALKGVGEVRGLDIFLRRPQQASED